MYIIEKDRVHIVKSNRGYGLKNMEIGELVIPCVRSYDDARLLRKVKYVMEIQIGLFLLLSKNIHGNLFQVETDNDELKPYYVSGIYNRYTNSLYKTSGVCNKYIIFDNLLLVGNSKGYDSYLIEEDKFENSKYKKYEYCYGGSVELFKEGRSSCIYDPRNNRFYENTLEPDLYYNEECSEFFNRMAFKYEMKRIGEYNIRYHLQDGKVIMTDLFPDDLRFFKTFKGAIREYSVDDANNMLKLPIRVSKPVYLVEGNICFLKEDKVETKDKRPNYPLKEKDEKSDYISKYPFINMKEQIGILKTYVAGEIPIITQSEIELDYILENLDKKESEIETMLKRNALESEYIKEKYPKLVK